MGRSEKGLTRLQPHVLTLALAVAPGPVALAMALAMAVASASSLRCSAQRGGRPAGAHSWGDPVAVACRRWRGRQAAVRRPPPALKLDMCASTTQAWGSGGKGMCSAPITDGRWAGPRRGGGRYNQAALLALPHAPHRSLPCTDRGSPQ